MNITLLLLSVLSRPELAPVGPAEVAAAQRLRSEPAEAPKQSSAWDSPADAWAPGRFVVGCEPGAWDPAGQWAARQGGSVLRCDSAAGFVVVSLPGVSEARARELAAAAVQVSGIRYFEPSLWASAAALPNDPFFLPYQWDKWVTYADQAWDVVGGSMDVKVAVVDNGVDWQHPDLTASFRPGELGFDFIGNDDDPRPDNPNVPQSFHGTHVAGIIAATRNNNIGIAGWSLAQLLAVRVLNDSGSGTMDVVASGIRWAANRGARIINLSLTSTSSAQVLDEACRDAAQAGVLLIAASGNDGQQAIGFPAALSQCIAVGATAPDSRRASFSNYGPQQEVVAPGVNIASCFPNGLYGQADGTSMAAPQVAGVAALILARDYGLSANEVRAILAASAIDMGAAGRDMFYGYGLVNAKRAVDLAGAFRAPRVAGTHQQKPDLRTLVIRSGTLPAWLDLSRVYDGSGRQVKPVGANLKAGMYFARPLAGSGPAHRLLVLD